MLLDSLVPTEVATEGADRAVLRATPVEGTTEVSVIIVRIASDGATEDRVRELTAARQLRSDHVQLLLLEGALTGGRHVLVTQAAGAVSLAERLHTSPPDIVAVLYALADIARGLGDIHRQGRAFGPLSPDHILLIAGPSGRDIAKLPPVWWAWPHGCDATPATPWAPPYEGGHPAARDAWALGAIAWHAITGSPPVPQAQDEGPALATSLPDSAPPGLDAVLQPLIAHPIRDTAPDLHAVADQLESIARRIEGGTGPRIAPPMLLATPVPVGGRLQGRPGGTPSPGPTLVDDEPSALPVLPPDGFAITPPTPPPRLGIGPPIVPDAAPSDEQPLIPDHELLRAARERQQVRQTATDLRSLPLLLVAGLLLLVVLVLASYLFGLVG